MEDMENKVNQNNIEADDVEEIEKIPLNRDVVKNIIFEIAADMFALDEGEKEGFEDTELEYDVKCDALDIVEFIMTLEDEFGVIIGEDESDKLVTFGDCIDLIWNKIVSDDNIVDEKEE